MKKSKLPNLIVLLILTSITVVFWIMFSVYRSFTAESPIIVSSEVVAPITPKLDTETLELMRTKIYP